MKTEYNRRKVGADKEKIAEDFLERQGIYILKRNFHAGRAGEIDLIGQDGRTVVFFEVKYRSSARYGRPEEAVGPDKQRRICRAANIYRLRSGLPEGRPVRFDVIAIEKREKHDEIRWIKDAFPYSYSW